MSDMIQIVAARDTPHGRFIATHMEEWTTIEQREDPAKYLHDTIVLLRDVLDRDERAAKGGGNH